ncbi:MAG: Lrp/AsnC family transcriptional regulator [Candidatus Micrarchaeota archaeon]|nr:Lrp/AsnC family transcriptional regulator [Candidatus Micrarchaeota archaeon]MDE1823685.1 Lrp/AsnC family transcriptional regulator [Candidatus Micrarchaeota archaeon]MDE1849790.1 Lrp/AsnC family transcriptional regulator [Candidatus Micrarchaeota archaeon]
MDATDEKIISILKADGRKPFVDIAKELNLTEGAIRARVHKLVKDGVIERFTIDTKEDVRAIVMVATSRSVPTSEVALKIKNLGIEHVYEVSGNYDIFCLVAASSIDSTNSLVETIRKLEGVEDTSTTIVLKND